MRSGATPRCGCWRRRSGCQRSAWSLRSATEEFLLNAPLIEPDDPGASDLDYRHTRLSSLASYVTGRLLITFYVDLLERNSMFLEVTLRPTTPGAGGRAEHHYLGHRTTSFAMPIAVLIIRGPRCIDVSLAVDVKLDA